LIPTSAQCSIELDDRGELLALKRGEIEFTSEEVSLRVEDLQVAVESTLISVSRQPRGVAERRDELLLLRALLAYLVITSQRRHGVRDRLLARS
jgi:hypothetical protein